MFCFLIIGLLEVSPAKGLPDFQTLVQSTKDGTVSTASNISLIGSRILVTASCSVLEPIRLETLELLFNSRGASC